jgi:hypothetical protein
MVMFAGTVAAHGRRGAFAAQAEVEPFHLSGGGRVPGLGQPVDDPVIAADPVDQHLPARYARS